MMDINILNNIVDYGIVGLLIFLLFISIFFYIERLIFFKNIKISSYKNIQLLQIDISKHTTIIASIASNSVYIGLLGTVFGIILTFYTMGLSGNIDIKIIMTSLSLSLKATALGLIVAIPSMFFYNHIVRKIDVLNALWEIKNEDAKV